MKILLYIMTVMSLSLISACGGGGSSSGGNDPVTTTAQGQFIDSAVEGLSYTSGNTSGVTDASGTFTYELIDGVPQSIRFSLGGINFGSAPGRVFLTPHDLARNTSDPGVSEINIIRLLITLDSDGDFNTGIDVTPFVNNVNAFDGSAIDFMAIDFNTNIAMTNLLSAASTILSREVTLVTLDTANNHITNTYNCLASGNYFGYFDGNDNGPIIISVDPIFGDVGGLAWSRSLNTPLGFDLGSDRLSVTDEFAFSMIEGITGNGFTINGNVYNFNAASGSWTSGQNTGAYSLTRIANNNTSNIIYRFTGFYSADIPGSGFTPIGMVSLNLMSDNSVEGEMVNIVDGTTQITTLAGTHDVTSSTLIATGTNGFQFVENTFEFTDGVISGNWSNPSGIFTSGVFIANGCSILSQ